MSHCSIAPFRHDADLVGERERLVLVVRDEDRRRPRGVENRAHLERQPLAQIDVEIRERLVEQQQIRRRRERPRQRDALLLAAGKLVRIDVGDIRESDELEHRRRARVGGGGFPTVQAERNVAGDA